MANFSSSPGKVKFYCIYMAQCKDGAYDHFFGDGHFDFLSVELIVTLQIYPGNSQFLTVSSGIGTRPGIGI